MPEQERRTIDIPPEGLETPYGRLYCPLSRGRQTVVVLLSFCAGPAAGWLLAQVPGDLSDLAQAVICGAFVLVFGAGYALWTALTSLLAFDLIGRSLLKTLFLLIVRRRKPESIEEVLPTREKLLQALVRAQAAGASFLPVSIPIGLAAGVVAMFFESRTGAPARFALTAAGCIAWGFLLARLGRRGWLPFAEED